MASERPVKRTALYRTSLALGAEMIEFEGWEIPAQFRSPEEELGKMRNGVGLADLSWIGKLEVRGALPAPIAFDLPGGTIWHFSRGEMFVTCEPQDFSDVMEAFQVWMAREFKSDASPIRVTDVTSAYASLLLAGPRSRDVLQRLTALDVSDDALQNLTGDRTGCAHVHTTILREDFADFPAYWLLVGREYGAYLWDALMHAGEPFDVRPIGTTAISMLKGDQS